MSELSITFFIFNLIFHCDFISRNFNFIIRNCEFILCNSEVRIARFTLSIMRKSQNCEIKFITHINKIHGKKSNNTFLYCLNINKLKC